MENSIKQAIVIALKAYMEEHKMTQADVHVKTGVRKEYINIILKPDSNFMYEAGGGKQGFIHAKYFNMLADLCGFKTEKVYWQTQPTEQTNSILANLKDSKEHALTITIIGETGCGKSFTAKMFAQKNPLDTFIVTAGASDTLGDLIDKILDVMNVHATGKSKSVKLRGVFQKTKMMKAYGQKPQLIIDESENLKHAALCAFKEVYDNMHENCSLVFIGTDQLVDNIEKLKRRNKSGIAQFHRRVKFGLRLLPTIDRAYTFFINDIEDKELKKWLLRNCNNYGELHDIIVPASRESERLGLPLTMELVRKVLNLKSGDLLW